MTGNNRCFLLWRNMDRIVATVHEMSPKNSMPKGVQIRGITCRELNFASFFNHLVSVNSGRIIGYSLQLFADDDGDKTALQDLIKATNVTGDTNVIYILLRDGEPFEEDDAQAFFAQGWVGPGGTTILSLPEWDDTGQIDFEITNNLALTIISFDDNDL